MADSAPEGLDEYVASLQPGTSMQEAPPEGLDDYVNELKQAKYGTLGQQALAGVEGLAEGVLTSPISRALELGTGLTTAEDIRGREEANPITKGAGEATGLVGSALIPGGQGSLLAKAGTTAAKGIGAVEKASFLSKVGAQAARSAFEGALYQSGKEFGDMVTADPQVGADFSMADVGLSAVIGGVFGGAFGAAAEGLKKASVEAAPFLQNIQEGAAAKALGFSKGQIKKLPGGHEQAKEIARTLMDAEIDSGEKIFSPLASAQDLKDRVESLRQSAGQRMNDVFRSLDERGASGINPQELSSKLDAELGKFWRSPINKSESQTLDNILESVNLRSQGATREGHITFEEAQKLKEEIAKVAYPRGRSSIEPTPRIQIAQDAYKLVRDEIDSAVAREADKLGDKSISTALAKAKKEYGAAKVAGNSLADRVSSEQGNKMFGLTDTILGGDILAHNGLGTAGAAVVLKRLAERYGPTAIASSKDAYLKHLDRFASAFGLGSEARNASSLAKATVKGYNTATDAIKSIFSGSKDLPGKLIPNVLGRDKLDRLVAENTKDPDKMFQINDNNPVEQYSAPYAATTARAVSYLNSIKPNTDPQAPLDSRRPASATQKATYNRALDIAQQPLVTLKFIQDGTLTSQDMKTLTAIYPSLYNQLSQKLNSQMVDHLSKKQSIPYRTKQSLSLFLGQPLDSTMTPQAIQAAQPIPDGGGPQIQQGNTTHPAYSSVKGLNSLSKSAQTPSQAATSRNSNRSQ